MLFDGLRSFWFRTSVQSNDLSVLLFRILMIIAAATADLMTLGRNSISIHETGVVEMHNKRPQHFLLLFISSPSSVDCHPDPITRELHEKLFTKLAAELFRLKSRTRAGGHREDGKCVNTRISPLLLPSSFHSSLSSAPKEEFSEKNKLNTRDMKATGKLHLRSCLGRHANSRRNSA